MAKVLSNDDTKREVEELIKRDNDQVTYILEQNRDIVEALGDARWNSKNSSATRS